MKIHGCITNFVHSNEESSGNVLNFGIGIIKGTAAGILKGVVSTTENVLLGGAYICRGDFSGAASLLGRQSIAIASGTVMSVHSGIAVGESCYDSLVKGSPFITDSNREHLIHLCQLGAYAALGTALIGDDVPQGTDCPNSGDACSLPGIQNGVFVGNDAELRQLIETNEVTNVPRIDAADIERSPLERAKFLEAHGIEDTQGWEVHHVRPLAAGGEDSVDNMVLISAEDHDKITAAHNRFYGWSKGA